jgi:hypothetical protein
MIRPKLWMRHGQMPEGCARSRNAVLSWRLRGQKAGPRCPSGLWSGGFGTRNEGFAEWAGTASCSTGCDMPEEKPQSPETSSAGSLKTPRWSKGDSNRRSPPRARTDLSSDGVPRGGLRRRCSEYVSVESGTRSSNPLCSQRGVTARTRAREPKRGYSPVIPAQS